MRSAVAGLLLGGLVLAACSSATGGRSSAPASPAPASPQPHTYGWAHIVIVVEENRDSTHISASSDAPYLNALAAHGLTLTDMHGETHPSQPNYLALLSGSTQGLTDDSCPHAYASDNLAHQLLTSGRSFAGYSEHLPGTGYTGCDAYPYARRHVPWVNFTDLPASVNQPLTSFPRDYSTLPTVSFVIPDVVDDMHDGTIAQGDAWLKAHLSGYAAWASTHNSLLLVTWDEDEGSQDNHIATVAVGQGIAAGSTWTARADHYALLRTIEDGYGLPPLGKAADATVVSPLSAG